MHPFQLFCLTLYRLTTQDYDKDKTICNNDAADGADVFALMTEWRQFRMPSWNVIKKVMNGNVIVDGRNIYDRQEPKELGFVYSRIVEK